MQYRVHYLDHLGIHYKSGLMTAQKAASYAEAKRARGYETVYVEPPLPEIGPGLWQRVRRWLTK